MAAAMPKVSGLDLVLAGPFEPEIDRARAFVARSGLQDRVHFIGAVGQEDDTLTQLYNAALALVHPTFYEGWCATPMEAMACGTPVVASDIPPVREVVGEAGAAVPPPDGAGGGKHTVGGGAGGGRRARPAGGGPGRRRAAT